MLTPHRTWTILDATKIQQAMTCPRQYFYRYILGWTPDIPNIHLAFGKAWHDAMETMLLKGYEVDGIVAATQAFTESFSKSYPTGNTDLTSAKSTANIPLALTAYAMHYKADRFPGTSLVKYTEIAGTVPINEGRVLHFKLDSLIQDEHGRFGALEHKTASRFDRNWQDQWSLSFQVFTYLHVLYCLYEAEQVSGVTINGTAFTKKDVEFLRIPIRKNIDMLEAWMYEANHWVDLIEDYTQQLQEENGPSNRIMSTFPKNTTACSKYFGCPFIGMCASWANPLAHCHNGPPPGFKEEWWDPSDTSEAKKVFELEKGDKPDDSVAGQLDSE
jgi:hypothetical protein